MHDGRTFLLPLELLLPHHFHSMKQPESCPSSDSDLTSQLHPRDQFSLCLDSIALCKSRLCPFHSISIQAPSCTTFTRSEPLFLTNVSWQDSLPTVNCSYEASELPKEIYLGKLENYSFIIRIEVSEYAGKLLPVRCFFGFFLVSLHMFILCIFNCQQNYLCVHMFVHV